MAPVEPPLLAASGLTRRYPGIVALDNVDLVAHGGEVHALVGANGAGKSTLMNLLSGAQAPSAGEIRIDGKAVRFAGPAAAQRQGIATVYQEFSLVPQLSVARNIFLGREPARRTGLVDRRRLRTMAQALLDRFGFDLDPGAEVAALSVAQQQLVEIARALSLDARVLILDEPTAVLSLAEQERLFEIIRRLRAEGMLVLYVSHHLREVLAIADRVTVLRDGKRVATRAVAGLTVDELAQLITGASHAFQPAAEAAPGENGERRAYRITYRAGQWDSRLDLPIGTITAVAGLVGAGRTTFARALAGLGSATARVEVERDGRALRLSSPREAMRHGIVYITEDRKRDGLFAGLDIAVNATAAALPVLSRGPFRAPGRERQAADAMMRRLRLVGGGPRAPVATLSGGNQQKVLIGRALLTGPRLLVCDEPTRGVDIGAKAEIHAILRDLARQGVTVLVVSSEIEELLALASRIVVMRERRFVAEMPVETASEAAILLAASGAGTDDMSAVDVLVRSSTA